MVAENPHSLRVRRIRQKLSEAARRGLSCFGSETHRFKLKLPIAMADLVAFETRHNIRLPEDYRTFLLEAGNGGAGPYYGLFPLDQWDDFAGWILDEFPADILARPCSLRPGTNQGHAGVSTEDYDRVVMSQWQGTLLLGSQGCSYVTQLIVSGPSAGRVAYGDAGGSDPYVVREPDFLSWYERWLDELLAGYRMSWFGYGPGGGEAEFLAILDDPAADGERKGEAAMAFSRLPCLSDQAAWQLRRFVRHPEPKVRTGLCCATREFSLMDALPEVGSLLADPDATVRTEAIRAVLTVAPDQWAEPVLRRLDEETDREPCSVAFICLEKAGLLSRQDLLRFLNSDHGLLSDLAVHYMNWTEADIPQVLRLLESPESGTRIRAAQVLFEQGTLAALPVILARLDVETVPIVTEWLLRILKRLAQPASVPALMKLAASADDFHRLTAVEALIHMGEEQVLPIARAMLGEQRKPERHEFGGARSHSKTIAVLTRDALLQSSNRKLRHLAQQP